MEFIPLVQMGVLVFAIINFLKALNAQEWNSVFTQVFVWIAGVAVVLLVAQTDFAWLLSAMRLRRHWITRTQRPLLHCSRIKLNLPSVGWHFDAC